MTKEPPPKPPPGRPRKRKPRRFSSRREALKSRGRQRDKEDLRVFKALSYPDVREGGYDD